MASRACCACWSILALSGQGVVLVAIVSFLSFGHRYSRLCVSSLFPGWEKASTSERLTQNGGIGAQLSEGLLDCAESGFELFYVRMHFFYAPRSVTRSLTCLLFRHCCYSLL